MREENPHKFFYFWALLFFGLAFVGLYVFGKFALIPSIFLALNISTFFLFGYDKGAAKSNSLRVPESVIVILAVLGGTPAVLLGILVFRHKTRDATFLPMFLAVFVVQLFLLKYFLDYQW